MEIDSFPVTLSPVFATGRRKSPPRQYHERSRSPPRESRFQKTYRPISRHEQRNRSRSNSPRFKHRETNQHEAIPSRTLFLGNLSHDVDVDTLGRLFEKYGDISDIDIKRPPQGRPGVPYAFIKFATLDMASRAKVGLNGLFVGGTRLKIGYGKALPSNCVWIGGLGPWLVFEDLEKEIVRSGNVKRIEWPRNKTYAYAIYDTIDDASSAVDNLRNVTLGNDRKRLRIDFCDLSYFTYDCKEETYQESDNPRVTVNTATNTAQLTECLKDIWTGQILLQKKHFGCRFFMFTGDDSLVTNFMFEKNQNSSKPTSLPLPITKRMEIDLDKLKEVLTRIDTLKNREYCIMLATSFDISKDLTVNMIDHQKPLQTLVDFLRDKNSSGVVLLKSDTGESRSTMAVHIFPPCSFVFDILNHKAPNLVPQNMMDDFVLILLMQDVVV